jgi:hypothetical protein
MELINLAIQASLSKNWKEAIKLNLQILKVSPGDTDALNRLAKAYLNYGFKTKSETMYKRVLKIDKYNPIALKGLENLKTYKVERKTNTDPVSDFSKAFLEEPGTTKTVSLIRLSDAKILSHTQPGDAVSLVAHEHCVTITNSRSENLGRLPDDLASRLGPFMKSGNKYQAWIKSVNYQDKNQTKHTLKVFIKEVYRSNKYKNIPSFPSTEKLTYAAFTPPELIHSDRPLTTTPEEDVDEFSATSTDEPVDSETGNAQNPLQTDD